MAVDQSKPNNRRANFDAFYKANPDKLKGKTVDEAFAAMQRESGRIQQRTKNSDRHSSDRQAAIQRRLKSSNDNPMTMKNTNPLSGVSNPLANKNGQTPWQRLNKKIDNVNLPGQSTLNSAHNKLAGLGNILMNKQTKKSVTSRKNMIA